YTLLTIGDGLTSQIPALIVSTAAGIMVSKSGVAGAADKALSDQFSGYPRALGMSSAVMAALAFLPGMPIVPFLALAGGVGYAAYRAGKAKTARQIVEKAKAIADAAPGGAPGVPGAPGAANVPGRPAEPPISDSLKIDDLKLELGY